MSCSSYRPWSCSTRSSSEIVALTTFLFTSTFFPVSTTWGTYLHAAGPAHVLLVVSALVLLDTIIERDRRVDDVPLHEHLLPRLDDLGHLPPRRRTGSCPARRIGPGPARHDHRARSSR